MTTNNGTQNGVYLYTGANYGGDKIYYEGPTNDTCVPIVISSNDLANNGMWTNSISSIKIIGNYKVFLYKNGNNTGQVLATTESILNLASISWDNSVNSLTIECDTVQQAAISPPIETTDPEKLLKDSFEINKHKIVLISLSVAGNGGQRLNTDTTSIGGNKIGFLYRTSYTTGTTTKYRYYVVTSADGLLRYLTMTPAVNYEPNALIRGLVIPYYYKSAGNIIPKEVKVAVEGGVAKYANLAIFRLDPASIPDIVDSGLQPYFEINDAPVPIGETVSVVGIPSREPSLIQPIDSTTSGVGIFSATVVSNKFAAPVVLSGTLSGNKKDAYDAFTALNDDLRWSQGTIESLLIDSDNFGGLGAPVVDENNKVVGISSDYATPTSGIWGPNGHMLKTLIEHIISKSIDSTGAVVGSYYTYIGGTVEDQRMYPVNDASLSYPRSSADVMNQFPSNTPIDSIGGYFYIDPSVGENESLKPEYITTVTPNTYKILYANANCPSAKKYYGVYGEQSIASDIYLAFANSSNTTNACINACFYVNSDANDIDANLQLTQECVNIVKLSDVQDIPWSLNPLL